MDSIPQTSANTNKTEQDHDEACRHDMASHGLPINGNIVFDGKIQRYSADEKPLKKDEWYVANIDEDGNAHICYASYSTDEKYQFSSWNNSEFKADDEKKNYQYKMRQLAKQKHQEEIEAAWEKTAQQLGVQYLELPIEPDEESSSYPTRKNIKPIGVRYHKNNYGQSAVCVPIRDIDGTLWSIQSIFKSGKKMFSKDSKTSHVFHTVNDETITDNSLVYICEGWATGVSIYNAIKEDNAFVVCAMSKSNIINAVEQIHNRYAKCQFILAADTDAKETVEKIANIYGCKVAYPECDKGKDFNDVHSERSLAEVKRQLANTISFESELAKAYKVAAEILNKESPCDEFTLDNMPEPLKNLTLSICSTTMAHHISVLGSLLTTATAFINKKFEMEESDTEEDGYFQRLFPNIWIICIAQSGQFKTTAMSKGQRLAYEDRLEIQKDIDELERQYEREDDKNEKKELLRMIMKARNKPVMLPDKMTPEVLLQHMSNGRAGAMFHSEMGGFIENLIKGTNELMQIVTDIYDCRPGKEYDTKTAGKMFISYPFVSIYGVCTASWLNDSIKDKDIRGGFYPRFLIYSLPPIKERPPALPKKRYPTDVNAYPMFKKMLKTLPSHRVYKFTPEGLIYYKEIYNLIWDTKESFAEDCGDILDPFLYRWCPILVKLSIIMQYFFNPFTDKIEPRAIKAAFDFIQPAIKSTIQLLNSELGENEFSGNCRRVLNLICEYVNKKKEPATYRYIASSRLGRALESKPIKEILTKLEDTGRIKNTPTGYIPI